MTHPYRVEQHGPTTHFFEGDTIVGSAFKHRGEFIVTYHRDRIRYANPDALNAAIRKAREEGAGTAEEVEWAVVREADIGRASTLDEAGAKLRDFDNAQEVGI